MRVLDEVVMSLEEAEAIRLKDLEGLEQEEGARCPTCRNADITLVAPVGGNYGRRGHGRHRGGRRGM